MTVKELYADAIIGKEHSLLLLIDYLIKEKKVIQWTDDTKELDRYFAPKNKERMNQLLIEYQEKRNES